MGLDASGAQSFGRTLLRLFLLIGLPLIIGQIIRLFILEQLKALIAHGGKISSAIILFIIFAAVSDSIQSGIWQNAGATYLMQTILGVGLLMLCSHGRIHLSLRWVGPSPADQIAAFYTASQKTLAAGVPMAMAIFAQAEPGFAGLLVLPLIIYHPLQLLVAGLLVPYWGKRSFGGFNG
jgi:sodium/bile acid cotransporter 7